MPSPESADRQLAGHSLRGRLADALGDPTLVVGYATPGVDRLVDEAGKPMEIATDVPGRTATPIATRWARAPCWTTSFASINPVSRCNAL